MILPSLPTSCKFPTEKFFPCETEKTAFSLRKISFMTRPRSKGNRSEKSAKPAKWNILQAQGELASARDWFFPPYLVNSVPLTSFKKKQNKKRISPPKPKPNRPTKSYEQIKNPTNQIMHKTRSLNEEVYGDNYIIEIKKVILSLHANSSFNLEGNSGIHTRNIAPYIKLLTLSQSHSLEACEASTTKPLHSRYLYIMSNTVCGKTSP